MVVGKPVSGTRDPWVVGALSLQAALARPKAPPHRQGAASSTGAHFR
jgi:hypothetical protein